METLENPSLLLVYHASSDQKYLSDTLDKRYFSHCIQMVIPGTAGVPQYIKNLPQSYFLLRQVDLSVFLNFNFISAFVKNGHLSVITAYNPAKDNCMSISPNGILTLSLGSELFHRLGLESVKNGILKRKRGFNLDLYKVEINLKDPNFYPGSRRYDRVLDCFVRIALRHDLLLHWVPHNKETARISPVVFLNKEIPDLDWKECLCRYNYRQLFNVRVPDSVNFDFFDWSGLIVAGADSKAASRLNETDSHVIPSLIVVQWTGFISRHTVQEMAVAVRHLIPESAFVVLNSIAFESDPTIQPNAVLHNGSVLSVCFDRSPVHYTIFEQPPLRK